MVLNTVLRGISSRFSKDEATAKMNRTLLTCLSFMSAAPYTEI